MTIIEKLENENKELKNRIINLEKRMSSNFSKMWDAIESIHITVHSQPKT